jgi:hypothetical protein
MDHFFAGGARSNSYASPQADRDSVHWRSVGRRLCDSPNGSIERMAGEGSATSSWGIALPPLSSVRRIADIFTA